MLLNKEILKRYSPYPLNYNLAEIMNYVDVAEKVWLIDILGYEQYEELQDQVKNNTLTPENSTLLVEALYPLLGFAVAYEALPLTWAKISEVGVVKSHSDTSESLTLKDMTYVSDHIRRQLEVRKDYAIDWIKGHIDYYPLICQCVSCDCGCNKGRLNKPNPWKQLYSTYRKNTNLR